VIGVVSSTVTLCCDATFEIDAIPMSADSDNSYANSNMSRLTGRHDSFGGAFGS